MDLDRHVTKLLQQEIERAWDYARLSDYFKELYRALLFSLPTSLRSAEIAKQIEELNSRSAPVIVALDAIEAREQSLEGLRELNSSLAGAMVKSQYLLLESGDMLQSFRLLSLKAVEAVVTWRQHVFSIQQLVLKSYYISQTSALPFVWENANYLLKMKQDTDWLYTSNLCKYFGFDDAFDPFIQRCSASRQVEGKGGVAIEGNTVVLSVGLHLASRFMDAELILAEETVCDSIKPPNFSLVNSMPPIGSMSAAATPHRNLQESFEKRSAKVQESRRRTFNGHDLRGRIFNELEPKGHILNERRLNKDSYPLSRGIAGEEERRIRNRTAHETEPRGTHGQTTNISGTSERELHGRGLYDSDLRSRGGKLLARSRQGELKPTFESRASSQAELADEDSLYIDGQVEQEHNDLELKAEDISLQSSKGHSVQHSNRTLLEHEPKGLSQTNPEGKTQTGTKKKLKKGKHGTKEPRQAKTVRSFKDRMTGMLCEELYEEMLDTLVDAVVVSAQGAVEDDMISGMINLELLHDGVLAMLYGIAQAAAVEVIAEDVLELILEDNKTADAAVKLAVDEHEQEGKAKAEQLLREMIMQMECDYANALCEAVLETAVQFELYSTAGKELTQYKDEVKEAAAAALQLDYLDLMACLLAQEAADEETTLAQLQEDEKKAADEALQLEILENFLSLIEEDIQDAAEAALSDARAEEEERLTEIRVVSEAAEAIAADVLELAIEGNLEELVNIWVEEECAEAAELQRQAEEVARQAAEIEELAEALLASLVEGEVSAEDIPLLSTTILKSEVKAAAKVLKQEKSKAEADALLNRQLAFDRASEEVASALMEEIFPSSWLISFAEAILVEEQRQEVLRNKFEGKITIEVPDNYMDVAFTPGIHSPNIYSQASLSLYSMSPVTEQDEEVIFSFVYLADTKGSARIGLGNIGEHPAYIYKTVKDYYAQLRDPVLSTVLSYEDLLVAETKLASPCWYWFKVNNRIGGLLLFSLDESETSRRITVMHYSTLYLAHYPACLKYFCDWLWHSDPCEEVRVNLYSGEALTSEVKKAYIQMGFRWKTLQDEAFLSYTMHVMGLERPEGREFADDSFGSAPEL